MFLKIIGEGVMGIDTSGVVALEELHKELASNDTRVHFDNYPYRIHSIYAQMLVFTIYTGLICICIYICICFLGCS